MHSPTILSILLTHGWYWNISVQSLYTFVMFLTFVSFCSLIKEETQRPKYNRLLEHPFIKGIDQSRADVAAYVCEVLDAMERNGVSPFTTDQPAQAWVD